MKVNLKDKSFLDAVSKMKVGETLVVGNSGLQLEYKFTKPTHFPFQQRIFPAGVILKKQGKTNVRIYIEAEKLGMKPEKVAKGEYEDRQILEGKVLPAERGIGYKERVAKLVK
jgi:hypothetical protein